MFLNLNFGENAAVIIICGILALIAVIFFIVIYVADFQESRSKAKKRRDFQRATAHARQRRRQKAKAQQPSSLT